MHLILLKLKRVSKFIDNTVFLIYIYIISGYHNFLSLLYRFYSAPKPKPSGPIADGGGGGILN